MTGARSRSRIILAGCLALAFAVTACSSDKSKAKALITEYLAGHGATKVEVAIFHTSRNFPDRAYTSATVTYNFASSSGNPQREFLGFTLTRAGDGWRIEKNTFYTKEEDKAEEYLGAK